MEANEKRGSFPAFLNKKWVKAAIKITIGLLVTVLSFLLFFLTDFHPVVAVLIALADLVFTYLKLFRIFDMGSSAWWKKTILLPLGMVVYWMVTTVILVHANIFAPVGTWMHLLPAIYIMPSVEIVLLLAEGLS